MKLLSGSSFAKLCAVVTLLCCIVFFGAGCSRIEKVKIVSHFAQPIRVRINDKNIVPLVPANGEMILDGKFYVGPGVWVTVLTAKGAVLKKKAFITVPGDSMFRRIAVVVIQP